jgi:glycosyltransferase involved in cell wall biosynthesis
VTVKAPRKSVIIKKKRKILLVSRCAWTLYNFRSGLLRALLTEGFDVRGGGAGGDGFESRIEALGVSFNVIPIDKRGIAPLADFRLLYALYRWYRKEKPDIIHHFTIKPVIYGSIAARMAHVPRIVNTVTGLGYVFIEEKALWLKRLVEHLYRFSLKRADFTFFLNQEDMDLFLHRKMIPFGKSEVLPGEGVDSSRFIPCVSQRTIPNGSLTFLLVARLLKDKGIYEYIEAAKMVRKKYPECRFQLLGRRDIRNPNVIPKTDIDSWTSCGLVEWLGEVSDVRPVIEQSDAVVLPSYREGTPRSLLEAAAMGKPLIATDAVGCREVVEHGVNGLLVPVKNSQALASAMIELIQNPEKIEAMGREGRIKVEQQFDEKIVIQRTLAGYFRNTP